MAITEHFNTIHFSQGISLFRTLKLKFPQFRFSTNSFNSLIMSYHQYLTIVNFQHTRSGFLFFDLFIFYPLFMTFFSFSDFSQHCTDQNQIGQQLNTGITFGFTRDLLLYICVNWGLRWVHLGFTLLGSTLNTDVWKRAVFP